LVKEKSLVVLVVVVVAAAAATAGCVSIQLQRSLPWRSK